MMINHAEFFAARLACQTDVADVHAALAARDPGFVLVDTRGLAAWAQGHIPEAIHMPTAEIATRAPAELDPRVPVVTYCWGPGCNGSTRGALAFARLGFAVKEMIGGLEYWIREGLPVQTTAGRITRRADPLTVAGVTCDC
jgi:rhodanese-related sulfurtransferase